MPVCFMLVGPPCSGKTTYYKSFLSHIEYASSDHFIESYAQAQGLKYQDVFKEFAPTAMKLFDQKIDSLVQMGASFVWDQTNMDRRTRAKKLARLKDYTVVALAFELPEDLHKAYYSVRTDKVVPWDVIESMLARYERPTLDEGFAEVNIIDNNQAFAA